MFLQIIEAHTGIRDDPLMTTRDDLAAIAATVTVTPHPDDRLMWFDAKTALP